MAEVNRLSFGFGDRALDDRPSISFETPAASIQDHYDAGRDLYRRFLDSSLVYSAAHWSGDPGDTLEVAQIRKLDLHLSRVGARPGMELLDIGCGWGGLMRRAVEVFGVDRCVGLTLSRDQFEHVKSFGDSRIEVRLQSLMGFAPERRFDAAVGVGSFEHLVRADLSPEGRRSAYDRIFRHCRDLLKPNALVSLQMIMWGTPAEQERARREITEIFPDSELSRPDEIIAAARSSFGIDLIEDRSTDYLRTLQAWHRNLQASRDDIVQRFGLPVFERYYRMTAGGAVCFRRRRYALYRLVLRRLPDHAVARPEHDKKARQRGGSE
jgi:cyclopropane-fatty-acyl-phospholipid synthase